MYNAMAEKREKIKRIETSFESVQDQMDMKIS